MEDPRQQSTPPRAKKGPKTRNKKNRTSNGQPPVQSSPNPASSPSLTTANRNGSNGTHNHNHLADCDTISNASLESSKSPGRRRRARGGRKSKSKLHIASQQQQQEAGVSDDQADQQLRDAERELYGYDDLPDSRTGEQGEGQHCGEDGSAFATEDYDQKQDEQRSDTGIRAFNARRADPKGRQPVWMKVQRNSENAAAQDQNHHEQRPQQQSSEQQEPPQQGRIPRISVKQAAPGQGDAKEGAQGQQQEKEVSIKFDLNLELELALKAKVKGEIMVTFL